MDNEIRIPLDLPDVRILEVSKTDRGHWLIRLESTLKGTTCKKCGREITDFHGLDHTLRLRHLPVFDVPVFAEPEVPFRTKVRVAFDLDPQTERFRLVPLAGEIAKAWADADVYLFARISAALADLKATEIKVFHGKP